MPKLKTHTGAKKRFNLTKTGTTATAKTPSGREASARVHTRTPPTRPPSVV